MNRDASTLGRYDDRDLCRLCLRRELRRHSGGWHIRARFAPDPRWPDFPYAVIAFPPDCREEANAVSIDGEIATPTHDTKEDD